MRQDIGMSFKFNDFTLLHTILQAHIVLHITLWVCKCIQNYVELKIWNHYTDPVVAD